MARQPILEGSEKGIAPHVAVVDNSKRDDGTFSRKAFIYDKGQDINMCPSRKRSSGTLVNGGAALLYRASTRAIARTSSSPIRSVTGRKSRYCFHT
jgi:hypothetical protein